MDQEFLYPNQDIPLSMGILTKYVKRHASRKPLAGVTALFIQHQCGNQVPQTNAMLKLGLDPKRLFWLDVPYTSHAPVREKLIGGGIPRRNFIIAHDYTVLDPYAPYQRCRVQSLIRDFLIDPPSGPLLVLDDGAYFIEAASCFKKRFEKCAIVEQTTRGFIKMRSNAAMRLYSETLPIVNVAESTPKQLLEPLFIGKAVCAALLRKLKEQFEQGHSKRCLILGLGNIGTQVARFASGDLGFGIKRIYVFDPNQKRLDNVIEKEGYSKWVKKDLNTRFDLVIGCSGTASFSVHDYIYLEDGGFIASASSGSVEFSRKDFIELADSSNIDDIKILRRKLDNENIHSDLEFQMVDRTITFLNGGFPVSFSKDLVNCIPTDYMQPTATMMVAASVQAIEALSNGQKGEVKLNLKFCTWLDSQFRKGLKDEILQLLPPAPKRNALKYEY